MAPYTLPTVLVALRDEARNARLSAALAPDFDVLSARAVRDIRSQLSLNHVQILITDSWNSADDVAFLREIEDRWPDTLRLTLGRADDEADAGSVFAALPADAGDVEIGVAIRSAARHYQLDREISRLRAELRQKDSAARAPATDRVGFESVLRADGSPMEALIGRARQISRYFVPVLLRGEHGTGKRVFARAIHHISDRRGHGIFDLDVRGLAEPVLACELFGTRGTLSDRHERDRIGLVQRADRGTLYLSNIEDLSPTLQAALGRVLTSGSFIPVGGQDPIASRVRIIAGTSADLGALVEQGRFQPDLYHALRVATLVIPPLRARRMDIPALAKKILLDAAAQIGKPVHGLTPETVEFLCRYGWPGNLRELEAELVRILIFAKGKTLGPENLSRGILQTAAAGRRDETPIEGLMTGEGSLRERIEAIEARILRETLTRQKWNKSRAADELGLSRVGLRAKLDRYGVHPPDDGETVTVE